MIETHVQQEQFPVDVHMPEPDQMDGVYVLARCARLEGDLFDALCQTLCPLTHCFANLMMPVREYPRLVKASLPEDSGVVPLLDNLLVTADRMEQLNASCVALCHGANGAAVRYNVADLMGDMLAEFAEPFAMAPGVKIQRQLESVMVVAPYGPIYNSAKELCLNAVAAMPMGGQLSVAAGPLDVWAGDDWNVLGIAEGRYARITIGDSGAGVAPQCRASLWDPFVTGPESRGFGLGLSFVYRSLAEIKGFCMYRATGAPGAEFMIWVPAVSDD